MRRLRTLQVSEVVSKSLSNAAIITFFLLAGIGIMLSLLFSWWMDGKSTAHANALVEEGTKNTATILGLCQVEIQRRLFWTLLMTGCPANRRSLFDYSALVGMISDISTNYEFASVVSQGNFTNFVTDMKTYYSRSVSIVDDLGNAVPQSNKQYLVQFTTKPDTSTVQLVDLFSSSDLPLILSARDLGNMTFSKRIESSGKPAIFKAFLPIYTSTCASVGSNVNGIAALPSYNPPSVADRQRQFIGVSIATIHSDLIAQKVFGDENVLTYTVRDSDASVLYESNNLDQRGSDTSFDISLPFGSQSIQLSGFPTETIITNTINISQRTVIAWILCGFIVFGLCIMLLMLFHRRKMIAVAEMLVRAEGEKQKIRVEALKQLVYSTSHDMRTPMMGIGSALALLQATSPSADEKSVESNDDGSMSVNELHSLIHSNITLLELIVENLMDAAKIEKGMTTAIDFDFRLGQEIENVVKVVQLAGILKPGVTLDLKMELDKSQYFRADKAKILRMILNTLSNSAKFTHHGKVTLLVKDNGVVAGSGDGTPKREIYFEVKDTGNGMSKEQLETTGRMFQRHAEEHAGGGTGLGLFICKTFVELYGGSFEVTSEGIGLGTSVRWNMFLFPISHVPRAPSADARPAPPAPREVLSAAPQIISAGSIPVLDEPGLAREGLQGVKVLLCEDNFINSKLVTAILRKMGCVVTPAMDGRESLAKLCDAERDFDFAFVDNFMPHMNGKEVVERTRKWELEQGLPRLRICAFSGDVMEDFGDDFDEIAFKPCNAQRIEAILRKHLCVSDLIEIEFAGPPADFLPSLPVGIDDDFAGNSVDSGLVPNILNVIPSPQKLALSLQPSPATLLGGGFDVSPSLPPTPSELGLWHEK